MDFTKALTYPFDDPDWLKKLGIAVVLVLLNIIPLIGSLAYGVLISGWDLETTQRVKRGEQHPLAGWDDFGALASKGVIVFLSYIVYIIPAMVFFCLAYVIPLIAGGAAASSNSDSGTAAVGTLATVALACCGCLGFLALLAGIVVYWGGYMRFLDRPEFGTFMQFGENLALVRNNSGDFGMAILYIIGASLIASVASSITFGLGGFLAGAFIGYFSSHILGQLAIKLGGSAMPGAGTMPAAPPQM
jgi:hypothetical protein